MNIPHFLISLAQNQLPLVRGYEVYVTGDEFHHLKNVLRLTAGEPVILLDSTIGISYYGTVLSIGSNEAHISIISELIGENSFKVTLLLGMIKPQACELVVEKCTELGVSNICFFDANRSQQRAHQQQTKRLARLTKIRDAAMKQAGLVVGSSIRFFSSLEFALKTIHPAIEQENSNITQSPCCSLRTVLVSPAYKLDFNIEDTKTLATIPSQPTMLSELLRNNLHTTSISHSQQYSLQNIISNAECFLIVGPEAGVSAAEISIAKSYAYQETSLGDRVLRAETAAIVACATAVMHLTEMLYRAEK